MEKRREVGGRGERLRERIRERWRMEERRTERGRDKEKGGILQACHFIVTL